MSKLFSAAKIQNLRKIFAVLSFKIYVREIPSNLIQKAANVFAKTS